MNATRRMELRRIENGLCVRCGKNPPVIGILRCESCRQKNNNNGVRYREKRIESGWCDRCGEHKPQDGLVRCDECLNLNNRKRNKQYKERKAVGLCVLCSKQTNKTYCQDCSTKQNTLAKITRNRLKDEVFKAYGGYVCNCCKEDEKEFLTIDHIDGNGNSHRKEIGGAASNFYRWLKKNNYPKGFQVLCMNCNWGRRKNGVCPHKLKGKV